MERSGDDRKKTLKQVFSKISSWMIKNSEITHYAFPKITMDPTIFGWLLWTKCKMCFFKNRVTRKDQIKLWPQRTDMSSKFPSLLTETTFFNWIKLQEKGCVT